MSITASTLTRAAAVALAVAGVLFILIQPLHPHENLETIPTSAWVVVHLLSLTMAVLALPGITAVYLAQLGRSGILALLGYLLFSLFFLAQTAVVFVEAFLLPLTAAGSPELTVDVASLFVPGYVPQTDVGPLAIVASVGALLYVGGGILFGIGVLRAGLLPRWTGILMIAASIASLSGAILPHDVARYAAVPMGVALLALGVTLFARRRDAAVTDGTALTDRTALAHE